jgi:hypothetical protein
MQNHPSLYSMFLAGGVILLAVSFTSPAHAADKVSAPSAKPVATTQGNTMAAGATEDSLQACLSRIPKDATAGQRMIAEQSCRRDEGDRKPFQATGGR